MIAHSDESSRRRLSKILEGERSIEVVCKLGEEQSVLEMASWVKPDLVLLSADMCRRHVLLELADRKLPVAVVGGERENTVLELLTQGAVEFISWEEGREHIIKKVKKAARAGPIALAQRLSQQNLRLGEDRRLKKVVVIACSTGGPHALRSILPRLPARLPAAVLVVQHLGKGFASSLAASLDRACGMKVKVAEDGEEMREGTVYITPSGVDIEVEGKRLKLRKGGSRSTALSSADHAMSSAARCYGGNAIGVVLTGMGRDGAAGIESIKKAGGRVIVQDRESSVVYGMPRSALKTGCVDKVVELERMAEAIVEEVKR